MKSIWEKAMEDGVEITGREILKKVLKPKSSYIRGLGYGVKLSKSREMELETLLQVERIESKKINRNRIKEKP